MNSLNENKASRSKILLSYFFDLILHLFSFLILEVLIISNISNTFPFIKEKKSEISALQTELVEISLTTHLLKYDTDGSLMTINERINEEIPKLVKTSAIYHEIDVRGNKFITQDYYKNSEENPITYYIYFYNEIEKDEKENYLKTYFSSYLLDIEKEMILNKETTLKLINYIFLEDYKDVIEFRNEFYENYYSLFSSLIENFEKNNEIYQEKIKEINELSIFYNSYKSIEILFSYILSFILSITIFNLIKRKTIGEKMNKIHLLRIKEGVVLKKDLILKDIFYLLSNSFLILVVISFSFSLSNLIKLSFIGYFFIFISVFSILLSIFNFLFMLNKNKNTFINYILKLEYYND